MSERGSGSEPPAGRARLATWARHVALGVAAGAAVVVALVVGAVPAGAAPSGAHVAGAQIAAASSRWGLVTLAAAFAAGTLLFYVGGVVVRGRQRAKGAHRRPRRDHSTASW